MPRFQSLWSRCQEHASASAGVGLRRSDSGMALGLPARVHPALQGPTITGVSCKVYLFVFVSKVAYVLEI